MDRTHNNTEQQYKHCAGKNCQNAGLIELEIRYVKKTGFFCNFCTKELIELGIASKIEVKKDHE